MRWVWRGPTHTSWECPAGAEALRIELARARRDVLAVFGAHAKSKVFVNADRGGS